METNVPTEFDSFQSILSFHGYCYSALLISLNDRITLKRVIFASVMELYSLYHDPFISVTELQ